MENTENMFARAMRILALATFLIGTGIFLAWYFFRGKVLLLGLGYIIVTTLVNLPLFAITLSMGIKQRNGNLVVSAAILLLNISVMFLYVWLVVQMKDALEK